MARCGRSDMTHGEPWLLMRARYSCRDNAASFSEPRLLDALVTYQLVRIENLCVWIVTKFVRELRVCSHFGRLRDLRKPSKTRAILRTGRGSAW